MLYVETGWTFLVPNSSSIGSSTQNIQKMYKLTNGYRAHQKKQEIHEIIRIQVLIAQSL